VFPDAKVKFFLSADLDIRTMRRNKQIEENNISFDSMKVEDNLIKRDKIDSERKIAPLKKAKNAFEIDTSKKSQIEVFDIAKNYIDSNFKF
jgi:cytidylate kinase